MKTLKTLQYFNRKSRLCLHEIFAHSLVKYNYGRHGRQRAHPNVFAAPAIWQAKTLKEPI